MRVVGEELNGGVGACLGDGRLVISCTLPKIIWELWENLP